MNKICYVLLEPKQSAIYQFDNITSLKAKMWGMKLNELMLLKIVNGKEILVPSIVDQLEQDLIYKFDLGRICDRLETIGTEFLFKL